MYIKFSFDVIDLKFWILQLNNNKQQDHKFSMATWRIEGLTLKTFSGHSSVEQEQISLTISYMTTVGHADLPINSVFRSNTDRTSSKLAMKVFATRSEFRGAMSPWPWTASPSNAPESPDRPTTKEQKLATGPGISQRTVRSALIDAGGSDDLPCKHAAGPARSRSRRKRT